MERPRTVLSAHPLLDIVIIIFLCSSVRSVTGTTRYSSNIYHFPNVQDQPCSKLKDTGVSLKSLFYVSVLHHPFFQAYPDCVAPLAYVHMCLFNLVLVFSSYSSTLLILWILFPLGSFIPTLQDSHILVAGIHWLASDVHCLGFLVLVLCLQDCTGCPTALISIILD